MHRHPWLHTALLTFLFAGIMNCGGGGTEENTSRNNVAPTINTQPASKSVTVGQAAIFTVVASGTDPLQYQWKKGSTIVGSDSATYTTPATTLADNGAKFSVLVTNAAGYANSLEATLTVGTISTTVPLPATPQLGDREYLVELDRWVIYKDGTHAVETTDHLNAAIDWAVSEGYAKIRLPMGTYLIGKRESDLYTGGIELQSNMALMLDDGAVLQMAPTDTWNSCVVAITGRRNVRISGGAIRGDRNTHIYTTGDGTGDDEGHCLCVQNESEIVEIDRVALSEATGDGILIVAQGEKGSSCKDIAVESCSMFDNRRQGISIVGGMRVLIEDNEIHHINGTSPQFGIDIESLSYLSRDIIIRGNSFHHNRGGDFVNCDGRNVLFENNTLDEGEGNSNVDGPIVYWKNADQTIRANTITVRNGSVNGRVGVIGYSSATPKTNLATCYVDANTFIGAGLYMYENSQLEITNNKIEQGYVCLANMTGIVLRGNSVNQETLSWAYRFKDVTGRAASNMLNGAPIDTPLSETIPYTSSNWVE